MIKLILPLLLLVWTAQPAQAAWRQASTDHFVIYSEESAKSLTEFATKLERYDGAMRARLGLDDAKPSPANRLTIFVVPSVGAVKKLYGRGGTSVAGFYMGRATGSFAITPRSAGTGGRLDLNEQIVLLHEYAHHFMMANYSTVFPAWFVEGFAEFYSTATFEENGGVSLGLPANHRAYSLVLSAPMKIEKLLTASVGELNDEQKGVLYGRGWLLTHYLNFEPSRKDQLHTYLTEINKGTSSLEAAKRAFGDLSRLEKELERYLHKPKFTYVRLGLERIKLGRIEVRDLAPGEAAVMDVRIRSKRGVDAAGARTLLPLVRKAAAPFPNDVFAQTTLAEAEYDAGNYGEAEAAADRALAADPKAVEALIYKGRAKMAAAQKSGATDAATWKEVRRWFLAANRLESEDPEPLILFYSSFPAAGAQPTANASSGLAYALALAPQDSGLRWMVAYQHLRDGKPAEARAALAPVAFDPHGDAAAEAASKIIARLDAGGVKAALEVWEEAGKGGGKVEPPAGR